MTKAEAGPADTIPANQEELAAALGDLALPKHRIADAVPKAVETFTPTQVNSGMVASLDGAFGAVGKEGGSSGLTTNMDAIANIVLQRLWEPLQDEIKEKKRKAEQELESEMDLVRAKKMAAWQESMNAEWARHQQIFDEKMFELTQKLEEKTEKVRFQESRLQGLEDTNEDLERMNQSLAKRHQDQSQKLALKQAIKDKIENVKISGPTPSTTPSEKSTPTERDMQSQMSLPSTMTPSHKSMQQELQSGSMSRFTSSTHPEAWSFLYRLTKKLDRDGTPSCHEEIYKAWHEGRGPLHECWYHVSP